MPAPAPKRRLPVLQPSVDDDVEPRPAWQWLALGAVAILLFWLLLANAGNALAGAFLGAMPDAGAALSALVVIAVHALGLALASLAGGVFVGRLGGAARAREAALAGLAAAVAAWTLAAASPGGGAGMSGAVQAAALAVIAAIGTASAYAGGRLGVRLRPPGSGGPQAG